MIQGLSLQEQMLFQKKVTQLEKDFAEEKRAIQTRKNSESQLNKMLDDFKERVSDDEYLKFWRTMDAVYNDLEETN